MPEAPRKKILEIARTLPGGPISLLLFAERRLGEAAPSPFDLDPRERLPRLEVVLSRLKAGDLQQVLEMAENLNRLEVEENQKAAARMARKKFADDNLQLAVLSGLLRERRIPPLDEKRLPVAREDGGEEEGRPSIYDYNDAVAEALLAIDLPDAAIEGLREIVWTDDHLHSLIFPQWSGEEHEFDVTDLGGLERCRSLEALSLSFSNQVRDLRPLGACKKLRSLNLSGGEVASLGSVSRLADLESLVLSRCPVRDLRPLAGLKSLRALDVDATRVKDLAPLLEIPRLKRLRLSWSTRSTGPGAAAQRANERVVASLRKRGVRVKVTWP